MVEGRLKKSSAEKQSSGEPELSDIVQSAASHREHVRILVNQGREDQIAQYTDMSTNEKIIQESMSRHMPQMGSTGCTASTGVDDEAIWETARLRTKVSTLESEKAILRENMRKMIEHVAELQSQVVCTQQLSKSEQARVHAAASQQVAKLEEHVGRQQNTMSEMAIAAEALASDNFEMSTKLIGIQDEKKTCGENMQALEERITTLQELYLRNLDEAGSTENPTVHAEIQQKCLDELATEEVLDLSRPPADFPIPEAPAVAKIRPALQEIGTLRQERSRLQSQVKSLSEKVENLREENQTLSRQAVQSRNTSKETASAHQSRMVGMLRRLKYLVEEMKGSEHASKKKDAYIRRLEAQLVAEHRKRVPNGVSSGDRLKYDTKHKNNPVVRHQTLKAKWDGCQGKSFLQGMCTRSWLDSIDSDQIGVTSPSKSSNMNMQSPLVVTSPAYRSQMQSSSHPSSVIPKDTLESIEEMERQLQLLDEEATTLEMHGLSPEQVKSMQQQQQPSAVKNCIHRKDGSAEPELKSLESISEQGNSQQPEDEISQNTSKVVGLGSQKSSKTDGSTPNVWVNPYLTASRISYGNCSTSSEQNVAWSKGYQLSELQGCGIIDGQSNTREVSSNSSIMGTKGGFHSKFKDPHMITSQYLREQFSLDSKEDDLIGSEYVNCSESGDVSTSISTSLKALRKELCTRENHAKVGHWNRLNESGAPDLPSTCSLLTQKTSTQASISDEPGMHDAYHQLDHSLWSNPQYNQGPAQKQGWGDESRSGLNSRRSCSTRQRTVSDISDESEARTLPPPQPIRRNKGLVHSNAFCERR